MAQYEYECPEHGIFQVTCRLADWSDVKACPKCEQPSEQILRPSSTHLGEFPESIVVHISESGDVRFPGDVNARVPEGFQKKEIRTIRELEHFERQMNVKLRAEAEQHQENEAKFFDAIHARTRADLRQQMQHMSPLGRDFAMLAMQINDSRKRKPTDCGFHSDILNFDRTNREPMHDERTGWKRKYY